MDSQSRRSSIPNRSPEALYHVVPNLDEQEDGPSNDSTIELAGDTTADPFPAPTDPPPELLNIQIKWVFFILGCAVLLPWNVIITALPFFQSRMVNSTLRSSFTSYLTTSFTLANLLFLAHATTVSKQTIPSRQNHSSMVWLVILNFCLTLSTLYTPSPAVFFAFIVFNAIAQATAGAYIATSSMAVASLFGPAAIQTMISGQAAVAIAVSGVQVIGAATAVISKPKTSEVSDGAAETRSAFFFFSLSTLFLIFAVFAHRWLVKTPEYQHVAAALERGPKNSTAEHGHNSERRSLIGRRNSLLGPISDSRANTLRVAKQNITYEIAVCYTFLITLAVFPPITASVKPTNPRIHPLLFSAVHFFMFNIGDFSGRYFCSIPRFLIWDARKLLILSLARTLFIPLFLMCNVQRGASADPTKPPIFNSDIIFMLLLFFLGWTSGYVSSLCLMSAASLDHNPRLKGKVEDVDIAATVGNFCLCLGLALGSCASFAVKAAICGCNPFSN
ncbi:nucleoside transporter-domain-containing protein [Crepidotus variabilis]|uniref:Nucleoside transporter-domain-containing protein n=1 Tax=Crepidotus variabilis TaxID=179855 RepID=A0A9P6ETY5_9AGAR|nr:nucleoside transporter-domain-containing protein [Crepidotus variabilis]